MPRSPCHFSLVYRLHERMRSEAPEAAALVDRHLPELLAGSVAPDGLRYVADMGKRDTHFYLENKKETWGDAIPGLFRSHPSLSDPAALDEGARAMMVGYIAHLTVDEAFRDMVTFQLHGTENWRPVVEGLWSLADEIAHGYDDLEDQLDRFDRRDTIGFVDCEAVAAFIQLVRPWAGRPDPWEKELAFLKLVGRVLPAEEARAIWLQNRERATPYMDDDRRDAFVNEAVTSGYTHVMRFLNGEYCSRQEKS